MSALKEALQPAPLQLPSGAGSGAGDGNAGDAAEVKHEGGADADGEAAAKPAADVVADMVQKNTVLAGITGSMNSQDDLSSVLRDPNVLQTLISALQKHKSQHGKQQDTPSDLEHQEAMNAKNLADHASPAETAAQLAISREERMKFNFRTEMCGNYLKFGHCRYGGKCMFAHTKEELRAVGSPLTQAEAAVADQVAAAIIHTQVSHPHNSPLSVCVRMYTLESESNVEPLLCIAASLQCGASFQRAQMK